VRYVSVAGGERVPTQRRRLLAKRRHRISETGDDTGTRDADRNLAG
jgi:hypothetical protein